ncbi:MULTISPECIES: GPO family capsid scaffolding protein [Providencia]|uniref:GPO family capsid scaffolding protein n=1 Tax=Providencia TaxID=586 RepID=UPI001EE6DA73|nr:MULTISPECIES: GPO family capsid scaffolding protein [Providencia]MCG5292481.1 GPO family capsid scaffolding protein [Providencia rettgeri]
MSQLRTTWLCIATEGDTVDGRVIERQDLLDAAELYDYKLYAALIWPEHNHDAEPMGEVLEVMLEENEHGELQLLAIIRPFVSLLIANAEDKYLFTSIELTPDGNFRGTGKSYLEGLAVTNEPASVGTTRLHFSRKKRKDKDMSTKSKKTSWRKLFNIAEPEATPPEETADGDKLQKLAEALAAAEEEIKLLKEQLASTQQEVEDVQDDVDTVKEVVDTEEFARLRENLPQIVKNFGKLDEKVTKLPKNNPKGEDKERKKGFEYL